MRLYITLLLAIFFLIRSEALADCKNPLAPSGTIVFNESYDVFQGCTHGGRWIAFHGKPAPEPCQTDNPGTACMDGSFYIGALDGGPRLYAAPADEGRLLAWKTQNTTTPGTKSLTNGYDNTYMGMNDMNHPAGHICATKPPAGAWYLPAKDELNLIWENRITINLVEKGFTIGTAQDGYYWSSSEYAPDGAWRQRFTDGVPVYYGKGTGYSVRCVRR